jgi:hypothetical protein
MVFFISFGIEAAKIHYFWLLSIFLDLYVAYRFYKITYFCKKRKTMMEETNNYSPLSVHKMIEGYWLIESVEGYGPDYSRYARYITPGSSWAFSSSGCFNGKIFCVGIDENCGYGLNDNGLHISSFCLSCGFSNARFNIVSVTEDHLVVTGEVDEPGDPDDPDAPDSLSANLTVSLKRWYDDKEVANILCGVTSIEKHTFTCHPCLKSISIPNSVTQIGEYGLSDGINLESIVMTNSLTRIGDFAFSHCNQIQSIIIPNSVTDIGCYAFNACENLSTIILSDSLKVINQNTFDGCSSLTKIVIPDSVKVIDDYAFFNCRGLISVIIPNSVTKIGEYAFKGCESLSSIVIPDSVTKIKRGAFFDCPNLWNIKIKDWSLLYDALNR